jgi:hypothetical protein
MGNMQVYSTRGGSSGEHLDVSALPAGGRLCVAPAYMQTDGEASVQIDSSAKLALFGWCQEIDYAYTSLSIFVLAAPSPGNLVLKIYAADFDGLPTGDPMLDTTIASGSSPGAWIRKIFDAVQCYRGRRYLLVVGGSGDMNVSLSCRRWNTQAGSMFPDGCWAKSSEDGGESWSDCTQDDKPALFNFVLASASNHCPQLLYGRHTGKYVPLYDDSAQRWGLYEIPVAGLSFSLAEAESTLSLVVLASDGTLKSYPATEGSRHFQDGIEMGNVGERLLGLVYPKYLGANTEGRGPIDVMDYRGLAYPGMRKRLGKLCPYAAATAESAERVANEPDSWNSSDDFTINFVAIANTHIELSGICNNDSAADYLQVACGLDSTAIPQESWGGAAPPHGSGRFVMTQTVSEGLHSCYPIRWISSSGTIEASYYTSGVDPEVRAEVVGVLTA